MLQKDEWTFLEDILVGVMGRGTETAYAAEILLEIPSLTLRQIYLAMAGYLLDSLSTLFPSCLTEVWILSAAGEP